MSAGDTGTTAIEPETAHQGTDLERLRLVYGNFPFMLSGATIASCVLVGLLYDEVSSAALAAWLVLVVGLSVTRHVESRLFQRDPSARTPRAWMRRLEAGTLASGLAWGAGAAVFLPHGDVAHQMLTILVFTGVIAGAMTSYGAMWRCYMIFMSPLAVLMEWRMLTDGMALHYALAFVNIVYVVVVAYSAYKTDRTIGKVLAITAENAQLTRALQYQATHDPLVDLVNHREFNVRLREVANCPGEPCALVFIDLDRFKEINDRGGHAAGDEALRRVSEILKAHVRASDTAARLGGDEFALLLPRCPRERAEQVAAEVLAAIQEFVLHWEDGHYFRVGASMGVACAAPGQADAAALLRVADSACYAAKNAGRGRIEVRSAHRLPEPSRFELQALRPSG
ncbi:MAG: GGDEF domain-containing protein [Steroidobacteraceae bacterium]